MPERPSHVLQMAQSSPDVNRLRPVKDWMHSDTTRT